MKKHTSGARSGFAMALAAGSLAMFVLFGGTLGFISSGASRAVVRTLGDRACHDLCLSALAEALVLLSEGLREGDTIGGVPLRDALRKDFPFKPVTLDTPAAKALARRLHPGLKLAAVTVRPGARTAPGQENPLIGTVELAVQVTGRVNGVSCGLEVVQAVPFRVSCAGYVAHGKRGSYLRFHWGEAFLSAAPLASGVKPL